MLYTSLPTLACVLLTDFNRGGIFVFFFLCVLYSTLLRLLPLQIPMCRRMLGSNPGLLRLWTDALNTRSHPLGYTSRQQWMRLPDFAYQTIIFLQSHKKKIFCFYLKCLAFFVCVQKKANQVIIYFILRRITSQKDNTKRWLGKQISVCKLHTSKSIKTINRSFVNKFASSPGFNIYGTFTKVWWGKTAPVFRKNMLKKNAIIICRYKMSLSFATIQCTLYSTL